MQLTAFVSVLVVLVATAFVGGVRASDTEALEKGSHRLRLDWHP